MPVHSNESAQSPKKDMHFKLLLPN